MQLSLSRHEFSVSLGPLQISVGISGTLRLHCSSFLGTTGGRKTKSVMTFQPSRTTASGEGPAEEPCFPVYLGDLNQRGCLEPVRKEDAINNNKKQMVPSAKTPEKLRNGLFVREDGAQMPWIVRKARVESTCSWLPHFQADLSINLLEF